MMRGAWACTRAWETMAVMLALNSSRGMCCLLGASGNEESFAPKKTVCVVNSMRWHHVGVAVIP